MLSVTVLNVVLKLRVISLEIFELWVRECLWVCSDDELLAHIGPKVPSAASKDHGAPFAEVFARYNGDFYKIDPLLFSPAEVELRNLKTGKCHRFGRVEPTLLRTSFGLA